MSSPGSDFALLLSAPDATEAELAKELLESHGIPSLSHGQDRDLAELGAAVHSRVAHPDLYVPRGMLERARAVLSEAWDETALSDEIALASPAREQETPRSLRSVLLWVIFIGILTIVFFITYRPPG